MKDESAFLQAVQDAEAGSPAGATPAAPPVAHLPLYRAGDRVNYQNQAYTVSHVVIRRGQLLVHLEELGSAVDSDQIRVALTPILLQRH